MNLYNTPLKGGYTYRTRNFDGSFNNFYLSVEVLGESEASYLIRILTPIVGRPAHSTMTVRKHNVKIQPPAVEEQHDYSGAWWNN